MSTQTIAIARLTADGADTDLARHIIEFDPRRPSGYRFAAAPGSAEAQALATTFTPDPTPGRPVWPRNRNTSMRRTPIRYPGPTRSW